MNERNRAEQMTGPAIMHSEAAEAGAVVARMLQQNDKLLRRLAARLLGASDGSVVTCGRGSSANAALYGRYLMASRLGLIGTAALPSISSVYHRSTARRGDIFLAVSQSGRSHDLLEATRQARIAGALTVAVVNDENAPLVDEVDDVIALCAGPEHSVAATKSFISAQAVFAALTINALGSPELSWDLAKLPDLLDTAFTQDWSSAIPHLAPVQHMFVLARGPSMGTAAEAALKLKEVAEIHAEAFSAAEVMHGPITLMRPRSVAMIFSQEDEARASIGNVLDRLRDRQVDVLFAGPPHEGAVHLPVVPAQPELTPILAAQSFYRIVADLSRSLGFNPDKPNGLSKVTMTI